MHCDTFGHPYTGLPYSTPSGDEEPASALGGTGGVNLFLGNVFRQTAALMAIPATAVGASS